MNGTLESVLIKKLSVPSYAQETAVSYLKMLTESIQEEGILIPLLVLNDYTIFDGLARYRAALRAGLISVPCHVLPTLSEDELRRMICLRYRLGD